MAQCSTDTGECQHCWRHSAKSEGKSATVGHRQMAKAKQHMLQDSNNSRHKLHSKACCIELNK